jgi:transposase
LICGVISGSLYDAGKKTKGKKRHIFVDTIGLLLHAIVHCGHIQDRDGGPMLLARMKNQYSSLRMLFADAGYQGSKFRDAAMKVRKKLGIEIIKRSDKAKGFEVLPKRWVVERTLAWLSRYRRLAKDFENLNCRALAFLKLASIRFMMRKLYNKTITS